MMYALKIEHKIFPEIVSKIALKIVFQSHKGRQILQFN